MSKVTMGRRAAVAALLVLALAGCKSRKRVAVQQAQEEAPQTASVVNMGDARYEAQLLSGFYGLEAGEWRWTGRKFSVALRPPAGAAQKGAVLEARLSVPKPVIAKLKTISLTATVDGEALPPETYTQAGSFVLKRDVPGRLLGSDSVKVEFELDKAMPPNPPDIRELGIVALGIGLQTK